MDYELEEQKDYETSSAKARTFADLEVLGMNGEIPKLLRVRYCMQEVLALEEKLKWQRERTQNLTQHISHMPSGTGLAGGLDDIFARLDELEQKQREKLEDYALAMREAEGILSTIPQEDLRVFVRLLYVEQLSPEAVRQKMRWGEKRMRRMRRRIDSARRFSEAGYT